MTGLRGFTTSARQLARNPLGVIALFIVLIYAFASSLVGLSSLQPAERLPVIWFLVVFPVLVLGVFAWLVSRHHAKLYSPADYRRDSAFIRASNEQLEVAVALGAASARYQETSADPDDTAREARRLTSLVVKLITPATLLNARTRRILWVEDRKETSTYEREALQSMGFAIVVTASTDEAVAAVEREGFDVIVSDLCRPPDFRAGLTLLNQLRRYNITVPYILYSRNATPEQQAEAWKRGASGLVSRPSDLVVLVIESVASEANAA